jgi:hypothetical protein
MTQISFELNNLKSYREYFQHLVSEATFLDFFAYTKTDFENSSSNPNRSGWCFILEPYTTTIRDNEADSVVSYPRGMFVITRKKTSQLKHWEIEETAQLYAHKVIGRMRRDRREYRLRCEFSNFSVETIEPIGLAGYYGVIVQFQFFYPINADMKYLAEDWEQAPAPAPDPEPEEEVTND